jgi:hypothetical protein
LLQRRRPIIGEYNNTDRVCNGAIVRLDVKGKPQKDVVYADENGCSTDGIECEHAANTGFVE